MLAICRVGDGSFDGAFFLAVKSTGIYCLASCPARFPLEKNIEFFSSRDDAEDAGYRGCRRCYSAEYAFQPTWLTQLVAYLNDNLDLKVSMTDLEQVTNRHRSTISAHFAQSYGMTAIEYFRQIKMETARNRILQGDNYRDVAFSLGYDSISGFRSAFKSYFGTTPGQLSSKEAEQ